MSEIIACNYMTDPQCVKPADTWRMSVAGKNNDGKRIYALNDIALAGALKRFDKMGISYNNAVVCAHVECATMGKIAIEGQANELYREDGWMIGSTRASGNVSIFCNAGCAPVTLLHAGLYTLDDWAKMQAQNVIWFDGETYVTLNINGGGLNLLTAYPHADHLQLGVAA